jgi:hypothetical protein
MQKTSEGWYSLGSLFSLFRLQQETADLETGFLPAKCSIPFEIEKPGFFFPVNPEEPLIISLSFRRNDTLRARPLAKRQMSYWPSIPSA